MFWDPKTYQKFAGERSAPFEDLLGLLKLRSNVRVVDLGCGTGELTRRLAEYFPESRVLGIDSSSEMLAFASTEGVPGLEFRRQSIESFSEPCDVIFSHAALHWISDHPALLKRLWGLLRVGGQLAVQVPCNEDHPSQKILRELAATEPFREILDSWVRISPVLSLREYAEELFSLGAQEITAIDKVYPHLLADADAMATWLEGTTLVPYGERLGPEWGKKFLVAYRQRLREVFPQSPVFFGFKRTIFSAVKAVE